MNSDLEQRNSTLRTYWTCDPLFRYRAQKLGRLVPYPSTCFMLIWELVRPSPCAFFSTSGGDWQLKHQALVAEKFARMVLRPNFMLEDISDYPYWKDMRNKRCIKQWVRLEADLWVKTLMLLTYMYYYFRAIPCRPETALWLLTEEHSLLLFAPSLIGCPTFSQRGTTAPRRTWQKQNGEMDDLAKPSDDEEAPNPFNEQEFPVAFRVIEVAKQIADQNTGFEKKFYKPVVKARMALVTYLRTKVELIEFDLDGNNTSLERRKSPQSDYKASFRKSRS